MLVESIITRRARVRKATKRHYRASGFLAFPAEKPSDRERPDRGNAEPTSHVLGPVADRPVLDRVDPVDAWPDPNGRVHRRESLGGHAHAAAASVPGAADRGVPDYVAGHGWPSQEPEPAPVARLELGPATDGRQPRRRLWHDRYVHGGPVQIRAHGVPLVVRLLVRPPDDSVPNTLYLSLTAQSPDGGQRFGRCSVTRGNEQ